MKRNEDIEVLVGQLVAQGLLHQIRYDRAVLYEQVGRAAQARREFERLYAEDHELEDVRARLNL